LFFDGGPFGNSSAVATAVKIIIAINNVPMPFIVSPPSTQSVFDRGLTIDTSDE